jgi:Fe-S cluster biogenesis protein NfuA
MMPFKESNVRDKVSAALELIRGYLQADGGDVELVDVIEDQGLVKVRLVGACGGCPMSQMTLQMGIERVLKQQVPEVKTVVAVPNETE